MISHSITEWFGRFIVSAVISLLQSPGCLDNRCRESDVAYARLPLHMHLTTLKFYGNSRDRIVRLGLSNAVLELQEIILNHAVAVDETASLSLSVDASFRNSEARPRVVVLSTLITRKELLIAHVLRMRRTLQSGNADVGVVVVQSDEMLEIFPGRAPTLTDLIQVIECDLPEANRMPITVIAVAGDADEPRNLNRTLRRTDTALKTYAKRH